MFEQAFKNIDDVGSKRIRALTGDDLRDFGNDKVFPYENSIADALADLGHPEEISLSLARP